MTTTHTPTVTFRPARAEDAASLRRLAELDSARPPTGEALLAFVDGEPAAALDLATGAVVADPFRPTADVVALLQLRAAMVADARPRRRAARHHRLAHAA